MRLTWEGEGEKVGGKVVVSENGWRRNPKMGNVEA